MAETGALISVEEYLQTEYDGDREYVDGVYTGDKHQRVDDGVLHTTNPTIEIPLSELF